MLAYFKKHVHYQAKVLMNTKHCFITPSLLSYYYCVITLCIGKMIDICVQ